MSSVLLSVPFVFCLTPFFIMGATGGKEKSEGRRDKYMNPPRNTEARRGVGVKFWSLAELRKLQQKYKNKCRLYWLLSNQIFKVRRNKQDIHIILTVGWFYKPCTQIVFFWSYCFPVHQVICLQCLIQFHFFQLRTSVIFGFTANKDKKIFAKPTLTMSSHKVL